jgi:hypothetical protein
MDENGLLYTFSTVSQSAAAAFALVAAFVLHHLRSAQEALFNFSAPLVGRGFFTPEEEVALQLYREQHRYGAFIRRLIPAIRSTGYRYPRIDPNNFGDSEFQRFTGIVVWHGAIVMTQRMLWIALAISSGTILLSTCTIPFSNLLSRHPIAALLALVFVLILFALCLLSLVILVIRSIGDQGGSPIPDISELERTNSPSEQTHSSSSSDKGSV